MPCSRVSRSSGRSDVLIPTFRCRGSTWAARAHAPARAIRTDKRGGRPRRPVCRIGGTVRGTGVERVPGGHCRGRSGWRVQPVSAGHSPSARAASRRSGTLAGSPSRVTATCGSAMSCAMSVPAIAARGRSRFASQSRPAVSARAPRHRSVIRRTGPGPAISIGFGGCGHDLTYAIDDRSHRAGRARRWSRPERSAAAGAGPRSGRAVRAIGDFA